MKYRGRLQAEMKECNWHHLASRNPYAHEERLCWEWKSCSKNLGTGKPGLLIDWTHGNIQFIGDVGIYINTKRKYHNIEFLKLPDLKMQWKITWNLNGDNYTGHNLFPSAVPLARVENLRH